jgi:hypothetical protein
MKAIVLTYDKYHPLADHMIHCYMNLWPDNPFIFRIPYQRYPNQLKDKYGGKLELIKSKKDIKNTILWLIEDMNDNDWILWCMDDYYPIELNTHKIAEIYNWINNIDDHTVSNILYTYEMSDWQYTQNNIMPKKYMIKDNNNNKYYRIRNYKMIWFHQFMRVKVLKYMFDNMPDNISVAKDMDEFKNKLALPDSYRRYVCSKRYAIIGESTNRGKLTQNCMLSMKKYGLKIPEYFGFLNQEIFRGSDRYEKSKVYYYARNKYYILIDKLLR